METLPDATNVVVTEVQLSDISDDVGACWRVVGPKLLISASKIHNIDDENKTNRDKANALLISWKQKNGSNATVGHLADVLESVGRRSIAERLLDLSGCRYSFINQTLRGMDSEEPNAPYQINRCDRMICEMSDKLRASLIEFNKCHDDTCSKLISKISDELRVSLLNEVSKMEAQIKALELELSKERQTRQDKEQEINAFENEIREMKSQLISLEAKAIMSARIKELEEENQQLRATEEFKDRGEREQEISQVEQVLRTGNESEELEEQLLIARQTSQEKEEEILRLRKEIDELKEELSNVRSESDDARQEDGAFFSDADQADREHRVGDQLKNINKQLNEYVTFPLQAPVVKQDQLRFSVRLNLLIRLSANLQELYTETQGMISEASKCSEDLRRDYYDLAYHGLRAEHFDLVHKVEHLESAQEEMSEEERKDYDRLQTYQKYRQRQVEALDKVWRRLFSPVDRLPKTAASDPTGNKSRGYKKLQPEPLPKAPVCQPFAASEKLRDSAKKLSRHSDPGARPKQLKPGGDFASAEGPPPSKDEGVDEVCLNFTQQRSAIGSLKSIFKKKDNDEKQCSVVSYIPRRDS